MPSLLTARNLPGIGDASPPEDEDPPECSTCGSYGEILHPTCGGDGRDDCHMGYAVCPDCNGTGYQPEPEYEPGIEVYE